MTGQAQSPCIGCRMRCVGCHGRGPDGAWRCAAWGAMQDALEAQRRQTAAEKRERQVVREYRYDNRRRFARKQKHGHLRR